MHSTSTLRTVTGPLSPEAVHGPALAHEHLVLDLDRTGDGSAVLDAGRHTPQVCSELSALSEEFGLSLVMELTCRGMGRDPSTLAEISRRTGVAVVAATGWYYEPFHPREVTDLGVDELGEILVREIEDGFGGSGIRPGVLGEVGSHGDVPSEPETRALRAAARAAVATGLSVVTHAQLGRGGPAQLKLLTGEGLPAHRVCLGHQDLLDDPGVHRELAQSGAYVAFDTIGKESYQSDATRLRLLLALIEAGHADRALLSCDISRHAYLTSEGGQGYGHLFRTFLPQLRAAGADEDLVDLLTRRNPLRFLTGASVEEI
ncbi:phosphotriesterase [Streptomyces sp. SID5785]|uniref:phosphotriesterase family protein n=1 Tax=Streptomyces sp. SID5785 TaxID=2690309 RepID=UPI001360F185|nr:phosphotriesterase [Streptomyces sp. SID5785]MZD03755.1 phosphotriesterase [Streptomyces sp. SID5785]